MGIKIGGGKSKSKQTTQQQQTTTKTLDPQLNQALFGNIERAQSLNFQPFLGPRVAEFNDANKAAQAQALDLSGRHVGSDLIAQAKAQGEKAAGYTPTMIAPERYFAATANPTSINRGDIRDIETSAIAPDAIRGYFDPYEQDVIDASLGDIERNRQLQQTQNKVAALKSKAFGGTGAAVAANLTDDSFARTAASTSAGLRSQGYDRALSAAQQDAQRRLAADSSNQGVDASVASQNAGYFNQAGLANQAATNRASEFNAGQSLAAQQANEQANQGAAELALRTGGYFGDLADQQRQAALGDLNLAAGVGDQQRGLEQAKLDAAYDAWLKGNELTLEQQQLINQALGLIPDFGTQAGSGSSLSKGKTSNVGVSFSYGGSGS